VTLTLVPQEPEDNSWEDEEIIYEASVMKELGFAETQEEWEDFLDHIQTHAVHWMQDQHDKKHHGK
jgi:hypothetical protein